MNIAFVTTQAPTGSTVRGRVVPLATELAHDNAVKILVLRSAEPQHKESGTLFEVVGNEPFRRTPNGKIRLSGLSLLFNMLTTACRTAIALWRLQPDRVVLVKPLPHNTLGVFLWRFFGHYGVPLILDADDFELEANVLTSFLQRAVLHIAEHTAVRMMAACAAATPFLEDRYKQLTAQHSKQVLLVPTGVPEGIELSPGAASPVLVYMGSLSVASGHRVDLLPAILASVRQVFPDATLLVAGHGDNEVTLQHVPGITLTGAFNEADISTLLHQAAIILDPIDSSITCRAKSSFRVAIAMAAGLPVVSSAIGIRSELVPGSFHERFFAAPADAEAYAERVLQLLKNPLRQIEKEALQHYAARYTWPVLGSLYRVLLK